MEMRDMGHLPRDMVHLPRDMHIPGLSQAKNRKKNFSSFSLGLVRDMHIPIHPAVKNDEKVFHGRETGDGDAPSPWGDDPYPDASP